MDTGVGLLRARLRVVARILGNGINLTASIVTLVPIVVVAVGLLAGYAVLALCIALVVSLAGNVLLWRSVGRSTRKRGVTRPRKWLPDPSDLSTLAFGASDFERSFEQAQQASRSALGPDAVPAFVALTLMPQPAVHFLAHSADASRHGDVDVTEDGAYMRGAKRLAPGRGPIIPPTYPWRTDGTWVDLVQAAWLLLKPFRGYASLRWGRRESPRHNEWTWEVSFDTETDGVQEPTRTFQMTDGKLTQVR